MQKDYWKLEEGIKQYYLDYKLIGLPYETVSYLVSHRGMSPSKARKYLFKMKKYDEKEMI
jgi:hypothetical protein